MSELTIRDIPDNCRAHILSFLNNRSFGSTQCASRLFHVASIPELLMRKIRDYSLCFCEYSTKGPYGHAAENGWVDLAEYLYKNEVPFTVGEHDYIAMAHQSKQFHMIDWFIEKGFKPTCISFTFAIGEGDVSFHKRLEELFPETPDKDEFIINSAIESGSPDTIRYVLGKGFSIPIEPHYIIYACRSGKIEMLNFLESHWGMTCRQALIAYRKEQMTDMSAKRKRKALKNPPDSYDLTIPSAAATNYESRPKEYNAILNKLCQQGFFDDEQIRNRVILDIFYEEGIDVLLWFKQKGWLPSEIGYPNGISYSDLFDATRSKDQQLLRWMVDNNITLKVYNQVVSPFEALEVIDRRIKNV
jgi:hypothetical protein